MYPSTMQSEILIQDDPLQEPPRGMDLLDVMLIFARHKWIIVFFTILGFVAVFVWSVRQPKLYEADAMVMSPQQPQNGSALLGQLSALSGMGGGSGGASDLYIGLIYSRAVGEKVAAEFNLQQVYHTGRLRDAQAILGSRTKVSAAKDGLMTITVSDRDPKLAAALANGYSKSLFALNNTLAIGQAAERRLFFDQQLAQEKDHLADAEIALKQEQEKTGLIQLGGQTSVTLSRVAQLQGDITSREIQLSALRTSSTDQNPDVVRIQSEIAALKDQLRAMQGKDGRPIEESLGIPASKVPGLSLEYIRKEREVAYHQTLYDLLARQLEAARIDEAKASPIIQVVDPAQVPDFPYYPKPVLFATIGAILGFVLGCIRCVVLFVYDYIDEDPRLNLKMWAVKASLLGRVP